MEEIIAPVKNYVPTFIVLSIGGLVRVQMLVKLNSFTQGMFYVDFQYAFDFKRQSSFARQSLIIFL
jgi:hypothetical protein